MRTDTFDVLVVGGGPAGSATAIALRNASGLSVAVVERSDYGTARLGETLSHGAQALLDYLEVPGSTPRDGQLPAFGTQAIWGSATPASRDFLMTSFGNGLHLDRRLFDCHLADVAQGRGATFFRGSAVRKVERRGKGWALSLERAGGAKLTLQGRFLVDATGKSCSIARRFGAERRFLDRQVAAVAAVTVGHDVPKDMLTLVEACEIGWWYSARISGGTLIVALMTDADLARSHRVADAAAWEAMARAMPHTSRRLSRVVAIAKPRMVAACSACLTQVWGDGWVAVGDAAGSHDPLSSSGIARSLDSGIRAALAVSGALSRRGSDDLRDYDGHMNALYDQYCLTRAHYYRMEQRWPEAAFWRRRQNRLTLSPHARITAPQRRPLRRAAPLPADLRHIEPGLLRAACDQPRKAHEAVAYYRMRAAQPATDMEVFLALQWLVSSGALGVATTCENAAA